MSTPKQVIEMAKKQGAKMVDVKFIDTFGSWQHFSCPIAELTEESFSDGLGFDGSSRRVHGGFSGDVDGEQAQGTRRAAPASASVRVLPLLRRLDWLRALAGEQRDVFRSR